MSPSDVQETVATSKSNRSIPLYTASILKVDADVDDSAGQEPLENGRLFACGSHGSCSQMR